MLSLSSCRHEERAPAPSASASALGNDFTAHARERHFEQELARARARWQTAPGLADCTKALKEQADLQLCQEAASALSAITGEPAATPELSLTRLSPAALTLVRLSERVRYLSLAELAQRRVEGDAGVAPAASTSSAAAGAPTKLSQPRKGPGSAHAERRAVELRDGPVSQLTAVTIRLERDVIRNLGAYLEYGPLPVRRAAFDTVKRLQVTHPKWPSLEHLLQEAALLELDGDLKRDLRQLSAGSLPQGDRPAQSAGTK